MNYVYIVVKSHNQQVGDQVFQSDVIVSSHTTRQGAEQKIEQIKVNLPTRSFMRYQIRKFLLTP